MAVSYKISVVIPTHNRNDLLEKLLLSLKQAIMPPSLDCIYIVENGSKISESLVQSFQLQVPVEYLYVKQGNKSLALNEVLKKIPDDHFTIFFDDDIELTSKIFVLYEEAIQTMGKEYYYGGPVTAKYEVEPKEELVKYMPASSTQFEKSYQKITISNQYNFLGANWGAFKSSLSKLNGFNVSFGPGAISGARGQETDVQYRLYKAGLKPVYVPDALVYHWVPQHHLTKEWVMDRVQKSTMMRGAKEGSTLKRIYWKVKFFWFSFLYFLFGQLNYDYLRNCYKGYLKGSEKI